MAPGSLHCIKNPDCCDLGNFSRKLLKVYVNGAVMMKTIICNL